MKIDTHFHIFLHQAIHSNNAFYAVDYDATVAQWRKYAAAVGVTGGVIVQPSFLACDNTYLLKAIADDPERLRGIAVVPPMTSRTELLELKAQGVCGVRLNLFGISDAIQTIERNIQLIERLADAHMHIQIHHKDGLLNQLLLKIPEGVDIVIDHFGRPAHNREFELDSPAIDRHQGRLWVKLSAPYRTPRINHRSIFGYWRRKIGLSRLLWGSDWPHTQHEISASYVAQYQCFHEIIQDEEVLNQILMVNPRSLYFD